MVRWNCFAWVVMILSWAEWHEEEKKSILGRGDM
jgi:hypothetical protein